MQTTAPATTEAPAADYAPAPVPTITITLTLDEAAAIWCAFPHIVEGNTPGLGYRNERTKDLLASAQEKILDTVMDNYYGVSLTDNIWYPL